MILVDFECDNCKHQNIYSHQIQSADAVAADNIAEMLKKGRENRDNDNKTD